MPSFLLPLVLLLCPVIVHATPVSSALPGAELRGQ